MLFDKIDVARSACANELGILDRLTWRRLSVAGIWRRGVPERLGGDGGCWGDLADAIADASVKVDLGFALSMVAHGGFLRALVEHGNDWLHRKVLPSMMSGSIGLTALTEAQGGSDVSRCQLSGVSAEDGWRITGSKRHITNGPVADRGLILGRLPELGRRDITLFVVNLSHPSVSRGETENLAGLRSSPTGGLTFTDTPVRRQSVLGEPGNGLTTLYDVISFDRATYGLIAARWLEPQIIKAIKFARQRVAFGSPILEYEYVQGRITDAIMGVRTAEAVSRRALRALDERAADAQELCSVAKFVGTELMVKTTQDLMRVYGHAGFEESAASRAVRDALGTVIAGGTSEMQRKNVLNRYLEAVS
ncbi:alkylation response protein AidB-like acyl-CoA dehydrogenase [Saccharomonospora amisosensis]|uniref:Alkylation response protein AidB-like acyl-CoA dehydrogenase n=1 Tax=Saccharomonospora amisosensis TaxID=1128677 RepID=A0A7X5UU49_9PSEU|nr:acyl-CoA dehydrogenase family protein [Saccharomonospora amisosensis]NIJ14281.1 alkylation response protein AidB-like acyl-CoA dehydrogenase [Saccharomonospora amisosensis]